MQTPPDKEKTLNKDVPVKPNEKGTKQEKAQRRSPEKVAREESMKQGDKEKRKTVTENLEHANGSRPNSANGSNNDSQPPSEEYFLVNLDCNFILLLDHMKVSFNVILPCNECLPAYHRGCIITLAISKLFW